MNVAPSAQEWIGIADRERSVGIPPRQPILLSPNEVDYRLADYFREAFAMDRMSTAMTYAKELRIWLDFLHGRGLRWFEAERADVRAFQVWRVYEEANPKLVTPATWNKGWAALSHFYGWAETRGWIGRTPLGKYDRLLDSSSRGAHREKNARASRDRWITPGDYDLWVRVGLMGYSAADAGNGRLQPALLNESSRARCIDRNRAFADLLLVTGLRRSEASIMLVDEVPTSVGEEHPIMGKGNRFRHYRAMHASGIESVRSYLNNGRARAVRRARKEGRYLEVADRDIIQRIEAGRRSQRLVMRDGTAVEAVFASAEQRARMFRDTEDGIEPASLWLSERGRPLGPDSWAKVFAKANDRLSAERWRVLGSGRPVRVTPHSLRFTFALYSLLAGVRAMDARLELAPGAPFFVSNYGQVFDEVRDLLGHANTDITRNTYLEPVKGLRRTDLLRHSSVEEFWEQVASFSPLIGLGLT